MCFLQYFYLLFIHDFLDFNITEMFVAECSPSYVINLVLIYSGTLLNCSSVMAIVTCLIGLHFGHIIIHLKVVTTLLYFLATAAFFLPLVLFFLWQFFIH